MYHALPSLAIVYGYCGGAVLVGSQVLKGYPHLLLGWARLSQPQREMSVLCAPSGVSSASVLLTKVPFFSRVAGFKNFCRLPRQQDSVDFANEELEPMDPLSANGNLLSFASVDF